MKSSFATDLLGAVGRFADLGGGPPSILLRASCGSGFDRLPSRDGMLGVSTEEDGTDDEDLFRVCADVLCVEMELCRSGVVCLALIAAARESPRRGKPLSAFRGGIGAGAGEGN